MHHHYEGGHFVCRVKRLCGCSGSSRLVQALLFDTGFAEQKSFLGQQTKDMKGVDRIRMFAVTFTIESPEP